MSGPTPDLLSCPPVDVVCVPGSLAGGSGSSGEPQGHGGVKELGKGLGVSGGLGETSVA